jgi:hypothetical protein
MTSGPDFFIVGAPKCGTTALDHWLRGHPDIFMAPKEMHFFGSDLSFRLTRRPSADDYFGHFSTPRPFTRYGEASVFYLYSSRAAAEIHAYNPDARIVVMLRNPVDMVHSLHGHSVFEGAEDIVDFREALAAESDRRRGRRIPPGCDRPWALVYRDLARYAEQLERYVERFGWSRLHVILFEDLQHAPAETYRRVLDFLEVTDSATPSFERVNASRRVRSTYVRRLVRLLREPSDRMRLVARTIFPMGTVRDRVKRRAVEGIERANTAITARPRMDPDLRLALTDEFASDIQALGCLLHRDLDHWLTARSLSEPGVAA